MVQGRSFTSNTSKLLKHLPKLKLIQDGKKPSPVMFHMSICNPCNLTCSFCCFANRTMKEMLSFERAKIAIDSFASLGTTGMELTGGGEPTLHPDFPKIVSYAIDKGLKVGVCTNGTTLKKWEKTGVWNKLEWIRLGMYGFTENYEYDIDVLRNSSARISAAYVWDQNLGTSTNPNITGGWTDKKSKKLAVYRQDASQFYRMIDWVEENKIPTRIAFNAIKPIEDVKKDIETIREQIAQYEISSGRKLEYAFLSDFNYKGERRNNNCYMHMVKPFVFTNGNVYVCPSAELSPENMYNYESESEFKVCDIEGITDFYNLGVTTRTHACAYCKYSMQNELIDDVLMPTEHNDFA